MFFHDFCERNKDENVHRFSLSALRGELFGSRVCERETERENEREREGMRESKFMTGEREKQRGTKSITGK